MLTAEDENGTMPISITTANSSAKSLIDFFMIFLP